MLPRARRAGVQWERALSSSASESLYIPRASLERGPPSDQDLSLDIQATFDQMRKRHGARQQEEAGSRTGLSQAEELWPSSHKLGRLPGRADKKVTVCWRRGAWQARDRRPGQATDTARVHSLVCLRGSVSPWQTASSAHGAGAGSSSLPDSARAASRYRVTRSRGDACYGPFKEDAILTSLGLRVLT